MSDIDQEMDKREAEHAVKNYTRVPNMLVDGYQDLHPQDKWLFVCLVRLCGSDGTRHLSLRFISKKTGFSPSVLSDNKKSDKPGMIGRLHNAGLIHAEIKRKMDSDGEEEKQAQYHITITNTWALNYDFYNKDGKRSEIEQSSEENTQSVLNQNATVLKQNANNENCSESERECSISERECSDSGTILRLQSNTTDKITDDSKITSNVTTDTAHADVSTTAQTSQSDKASLSAETTQDTKEEKSEEVSTPTQKESAPRRSVASGKGKQAKKDTLAAMLRISEIAAPQKPDPATHPYNVEMFMKLGDYYRGTELTPSTQPNSRYQKALKAAMSFVQRKIEFERVDKVFCFMSGRGVGIGLPDLKDARWIAGKYNTDLWTVESNFTNKWLECVEMEKTLQRPSKGTSASTTALTHDEAIQLAADALAQTKQHGYSKIQATAYHQDGTWLVKVVWEDGNPLSPIKSREDWNKAFKENYEMDQEDQKGAK